MKIASTLCLFIAGCLWLFVMTGAFMQIDNQMSLSIKLSLVKEFSLYALFFLVMGLMVNRFKQWRYHSAIVLVISAAIMTFEIFTVYMIKLDKNFMQTIPELEKSLQKFEDYQMGFAITAIIAAIGCLLWLWHIFQSSKSA